MKKSFLLGLAAMLLPLTTWAQGTFKVTADDVPYKGTQTAPEVTVTLEGVGNLVAGIDYIVSYTTEDGEKIIGTPKNAGKYKAIVTGFPGTKYDGYKNEEDAPFEVKKHKVSVLSLADGYQALAKVTYGDEKLEGIDLEKLVTVPAADVQEGDVAANVLECVSLQKSEDTQNAKNVGDALSVYVNPVSATENKSNYEYDPTGQTRLIIPITIEPRVLTLTFTGREFKVQNGAAYETPISTLEGAKDDAWYFGEDEVVDGDNVTIGLEIVAPANAKLASVGTYTLKATVKGDDLAKKNYTFGDKTFEYEIREGNLTIARTQEQAEKTYGETEDLYALFTYTATSPTGPVTLNKTQVQALGVTVSRESGENVKYGGTDGKTVVGYNITIAGGTNFNIVGYDTPTAFKINPKAIGNGNDGGVKDNDITLTPANEEDLKTILTYKGENFVGNEEWMKGLFILTDTRETLEDLELESGLTQEDYTIYVHPTTPGNGSARNAGDKFLVIVTGKGNYDGFFYTQEFEIGKADLNISVIDDNVKLKKVAGEPNPNWYDDIFNFDTLLGDDAENPQNVVTFKVSGTTDAPGIHYVNLVKQDGANNYNITYKTVQFEILADNITLYGELPEGEETNSEKLKKYNGETVTVIIKNIKELYSKKNTLVENEWHSMALPFNTTAREISNNLGYAVVDVADTKETSPKDVFFRLNVGEVLANQPFLVKLDATRTFDGEDKLPEVMTFENVRIEYNPNEEGEVETEAGGNKVFYAVYDEKVLANDRSLFFVYRGNMYGANQGYAGDGTGITVWGLNGYVKTGDESNPAAARLIIEEADGSVTAIDAVTGEVENSTAEGWYTVSGVKLNAQPTEKGIYINNGKKVVIK